MLQLVIAIAAAAAPQSAPIVTCLYDAMNPADRDATWKGNIPTATDSEKAAAKAAASAAAARCGLAGWPPQRRSLVGSYTIARIRLEHIATILPGVRPEMFHRVVAGVTPQVRAAILHRAVDDDLHRELLQKLRAQGLPEVGNVEAFVSQGLNNAAVMFEVERVWPTLP